MASAYSQFLDSQYPMSNDVSNSINISALDDWMESGFYVFLLLVLLLLLLFLLLLLLLSLLLLLLLLLSLMNKVSKGLKIFEATECCNTSYTRFRLSSVLCSVLKLFK